MGVFIKGNLFNEKLLAQSISTILVVGAIFMTSVFAIAAVNLSEPESVPGEYVVKLHPNYGVLSFSTQQMKTLAQHLGVSIKSTIPEHNLIVVKRAVFENQNSAIKSLSQSPMVEYAEPNFIYRINKTPNDPSFEKLWGLSNLGIKDVSGVQGVKGVDIDALRAWDIETGSDKMVVAIIDTGIDYNHPDLAPNVWTNEAELNGKAGVDDDGNGYIDDIHGFSFKEATKPTADPLDDHGHGSHCSGTIGAHGDDGKGIVGVNWNVRLMGVKFLGADGSGSLEGAIMAIDYAIKNGAKVLSNSWGGGGFSQTLKDAIQRANDAGAIFIAAAGNNNTNNDAIPSYPASYDLPNLVSVAAIGNTGALASFSNYGKGTVHIAAPGVNIYSSVKGGVYEVMSGTSMATPHVSGVAALVWAHEPNLTNVELKARLLTTVTPLGSLKNKVKTGGMVNAYNALTNTVAPPDPNDPSGWASKEISISTKHPYIAKTNQTFEVNVPEAKEFAVYFPKFETERNYDVVSFYDSKGVLIGKISGNQPDIYSPIIKGTYVKMVFTSDDSVNGYGFDATKVSYR